MTPNEIRKEILQAIYNSEDRNNFNSGFKELSENVGEKQLYNEIKYLRDKGYLEAKFYIGGSYSLKITPLGIDSVEQPEESNKLPPVSITHIQNVSKSNINVNSPNATQSLGTNKISEEVINLLKEMKEAIDRQDKNKSLSVFEKILSISKDIAIGILSNGIYECLKRYGIII